MTEKDWADETALELKRIGHLGAKSVAAALRAAERRGRAMGLREAAEYVRVSQEKCWNETTLVTIGEQMEMTLMGVVKVMLDKADKLDSTE